MTDEQKLLEKELLELAAEMPREMQAAVTGCIHGMIAVAKQIKKGA